MTSDETCLTQQFGRRTGSGKRLALRVVDFINGFADPQLLGGSAFGSDRGHNQASTLFRNASRGRSDKQRHRTLSVVGVRPAVAFV